MLIELFQVSIYPVCVITIIIRCTNHAVKFNYTQCLDFDLTVLRLRIIKQTHCFMARFASCSISWYVSSLFTNREKWYWKINSQFLIYHPRNPGWKRVKNKTQANGCGNIETNQCFMLIIYNLGNYSIVRYNWTKAHYKKGFQVSSISCMIWRKTVVLTVLKTSWNMEKNMSNTNFFYYKYILLLRTYF